MKYIGLLIKPVSGSCDMRCNYCFYHDLSEKRSVSNFGRMSEETLEILVKKVMDECEVACSFAFQGGEPTLIGLDFYKKLVELQKEYNRNGIQVSNSIQTNGFSIDESWAEFFSKERFLVGVSIDGDKTLHDTSRIDHAGKGTHSRILQSVEILNRHGVDYNILCVLTSYLARYPERVYNYFKKMGFEYLQFIPCLDPLGEDRGGSFFSLTPKRYEVFLKTLFDLWYADCKRSEAVSIRNFDNWLGMTMGQPPENCAMSGRCSAYSVVEADGSVFPCDFYVTDEWKIGDIRNERFEDMLASDRAKEFEKVSTQISESCIKCEHYYLCRGGCRRDRTPEAGGNYLNYYCSAYKSFFSYATERFVEIAGMDHPYRMTK